MPAGVHALKKTQKRKEMNKGPACRTSHLSAVRETIWLLSQAQAMALGSSFAHAAYLSLRCAKQVCAASVRRRRPRLAAVCASAFFSLKIIKLQKNSTVTDRCAWASASCVESMPPTTASTSLGRSLELLDSARGLELLDSAGFRVGMGLISLPSLADY